MLWGNFRNKNHWFHFVHQLNNDTSPSSNVKLCFPHIYTTVPSFLHLLRPVTKHTPNCVAASPVSRGANCDATCRVQPRLTAQPRVVLSGPDAFDFHPLPAECGQNKSLSEEVAAVVDQPVACHVIVVCAWRQWKSTCVWPGRRWWEGTVRQRRWIKNAFLMLQ